MKKIALVFFASFLFVYGKAQYVTIPDTAFANWLQTYYPFCMNGNMLDTACGAVNSESGISLSSPNIVNLYGLRYFYSLLILEVNYCSSLTTLDELPSGLFTLSAIDSPLDSLPALPSGLASLELRNVNISVWPPIPSSLATFSCDNCGLTTLPPLPNTLWQLHVPNNSLTSVPPIFNGLSALGVSGNQLTSLPPLPSGLGDLKCASNQLTSIPALPSNLYGLDCSNNQISSLPALPGLLQSLFCNNNQISSLPALPQNMNVLYASDNNLTTLPILPASLTQLDVSSNQLSTLPALPQGLSILDCANNLLTQIDSFPRNLYTLDCSSNQLTCLPKLPDPAGFISGTLLPNPLQCLPNYTAWMTSQPLLLAMPLCLPGNQNGCPVVNAVYGNVYNDANSNCVYSAPDVGLGNIGIQLLNSSGNPIYQTSTSASGSFTLPANTTGNYSVMVDQGLVPFLSSSCPGGFTQPVLLSSANPVAQNLNIDAGCNGSYDPAVLSVVHSGMVFPSLNHSVRVVAGDVSTHYGLGCGAGQSGQVTVTVSGPVVFSGILSGSQTPSQSGNTFVYAVSDFSTFNMATSIGLEFQTDFMAQISDTVCVSVVVSGTGNDAAPANNSLTYCYPVTNSYDPNMKEAYPGVVVPGFSDWITYTIHFQNNGTAPALNISVSDQLSTMLDSSSFLFLSASHSYNWTLSGGKLNVLFPNIMLTDSASNYAASQGWFQFRIKPAGNYPAGTVIPNSAAIYFDYNPPIITNTSTVSYTAPIGISENHNLFSLNAYPNPAHNAFTITSNHEIHDGKLLLISTTGQTVKLLPFSGTSATVDVTGLAAGVYVVMLNDTQQRSRIRMVIY
jgi:uncharacterized repeat protein (TIGR01451 family)